MGWSTGTQALTHSKKQLPVGRDKALSLRISWRMLTLRPVISNSMAAPPGYSDYQLSKGIPDTQQEKMLLLGGHKRNFFTRLLGLR